MTTVYLRQAGLDAKSLVLYDPTSLGGSVNGWAYPEGIDLTLGLGTLSLTAAANITPTGIDLSLLSGTSVGSGNANISISGISLTLETGPDSKIFGDANTTLVGTPIKLDQGTINWKADANITTIGESITLDTGAAVGAGGANATITGLSLSLRQAYLGTLPEAEFVFIQPSFFGQSFLVED